MILSSLHVRNYRSVVDSGVIPIKRLFAFVGENNCGKSNLIRSIEFLMSVGAGGLERSDFNNPANPIIVKGVFDTLSDEERKRWRPYLVNNQLILEKHLTLRVDERTAKDKIEAEFHGYTAEPSDWFLSVSKIEARYPGRVNWKDVVDSNALPAYFVEDGRCTKAIFLKSLARYISENDVQYDAPDLSSTQALGFPSNVVATLPAFYLLKAITDYSDEIDKRSTSSTFRRLMGDLGDRILRRDPRYLEIQAALDTVRTLFNKAQDGTQGARLQSLTEIEARFTSILRDLMPSVRQVSMSIDVEEARDVFSAGVELSVDDGAETAVLAKGHGLQRCIVFTLLQTLILNERNQLIPLEGQIQNSRTILLAIEEPELYIHPQLSKLFFDVIRLFAVGDQVIYSTHSPLFVDAFEYESVAIVRKNSAADGTKVTNCDTTAFDGLTERGIFKGLTLLNPSVSELFFARKVLLVEGPEDLVAVTSALRRARLITTRIEELNWSIIVSGGKQSIPFFQRVLNAFSIPYAVLHDHDIVEGMPADRRTQCERLNATIRSLAGANPVHEFPVNLEILLGLDNHFGDQYDAHRYFQDPANANDALVSLVKQSLGIV